MLLANALTLLSQLFGFFVSKATLKSHSVASAIRCFIILSLLGRVTNRVSNILYPAFLFIAIMKGGFFMATTRIMPLHVGKGRTIGKAISDIIDYVENPQKTDNGRLITGYACDSRSADAEFLFAKRQYISNTGRVRGEDDVIAYHFRQSFIPGEITPEEVNRIGCELAKRFTKENHAYVVCTHIDKEHIHNHIIWNSVNLECDRKFQNFWGSTRAVRRLNDTICIENGYSIVENPKVRGKSYNKWLGDQAKPSQRELLRVAIDNALAKKPASLEELFGLLQEDGIEVSTEDYLICWWTEEIRYSYRKRTDVPSCGYTFLLVHVIIFSDL